MIVRKLHKSGFTLVELSIVLVIIGLLIGGILVGQSLISAAKIQALSRQIGQFDAAIASFQAKFNASPGDNGLFGLVTGGGMTVNNGIITSATGNASGFSGEIGRFWADLSISGLANESGSAYAPQATLGTVSTGINVPAAKLGTNANILVTNIQSVNYYSLGRHSAGNPAVAIAMAFKPVDVLALDAKMDDGRAETGAVLGSDEFTLGSIAVDDDDCAVGNDYKVNSNSDQCAIYIRMGASTGMSNKNWYD